MNGDIRPGLLVLHGNRLELLRDAVFDWLARRPLEPLEEEVFLVQSNGAAEWLKMSLAQGSGICAATRVELPARFLWRSYRQVLGRGSVGSGSPLDKQALAWRLMRLLPGQLAQPGFDAIAGFLTGNDLSRRLQLAQQLADLYDQYQVYRADWLAAWEQGRDALPVLGSTESPLQPDQHWQAALWRALLAELPDSQRRHTRTQVHQDFLAALRGAAPSAEPLPRRVVLFGAAHVPGQTLEALAALASRCQVLIAIPNPCRFHWADIMEGRELLRPTRQRLPEKTSTRLADVALPAMHEHAHPLLAAWGRQGRDFIRLLDSFDDTERARRQIDIPRVDLFDEGSGVTLLEQAQACIRDLVPLSEHGHGQVAASDQSIVFHVAHSAQREVEILHDQLLKLLAAPVQGAAINPRDIVVMVPDVELFAAAVRAVFGQHAREDARFIPYDIADLKNRHSVALLVAVEWLLRLPDQRFRTAEVRALLEVPGIAQRCGLSCADLPKLWSWIEGAGVRWGLHSAQRGSLGLRACGEQNSWRFGLNRMLLGYASGDAEAFAGIQPYEEIGGPDAALVGSLHELLGRLEAWWQLAQVDASPLQWADRARALLEALCEPIDELERMALATLDMALSTWLEACDRAAFAQPLSLAVFREAWLSGLDGSGAGSRFLAGGVTFCTLMPLRAVPFEVVCMLGMNEADYPRRGQHSDFDLMAMPGHQRPGDRSRKDDDRYLMLEALLSARRVFYVSWSGRSLRDNSPQPPCVLVAQLRDYLAAGWKAPGPGHLLQQRTTEHPLQPFSRRYFEGEALFSYAREWRTAHESPNLLPVSDRLPDFDAPPSTLTADQLVRFLKNPVREFFRLRLNVVFDDELQAEPGDELFALDGLARHQLLSELLVAGQAAGEVGTAQVQGAQGLVAARLSRILAAGKLPMADLGVRAGNELSQAAAPMLSQWAEMTERYPLESPKKALSFQFQGIVIDDLLEAQRGDGASTVRIELGASRLLDSMQRAIKPHQLLQAWVRMLLASACNEGSRLVLIGQDATLVLPALDTEFASQHLRVLLSAWQAGMQSPLPFAPRTALAFLDKPEKAALVFEPGFAQRQGEGEEPCLARLHPDFASLAADGRFAEYAEQLFAPLLDWARSAQIDRRAGKQVLMGQEADDE